MMATADFRRWLYYRAKIPPHHRWWLKGQDTLGDLVTSRAPTGMVATRMSTTRIRQAARSRAPRAHYLAAEAAVRFVAIVGFAQLHRERGGRGVELSDLDMKRIGELAPTLFADRQPRLATKGPGVLDVALWTQKRSMTARLVHLTNPMMMKGLVRELIPIGAQLVTIRNPEDRQIAKAHLLIARTEAQYRRRGGFIEMEIPSRRLKS